MPKVVKPQKVAECLRVLRSQRVHRHFPGYLCVVRAAANAGRTRDLRPEFKSFYDTFLRVPGGPMPYVSPCVEDAPSPANEWFNSNVAGSYAPGSIRDGQPLSRVIEVRGRGRDGLYSLREDHSLLALRHLTFGEALDPLPLAAFLYRNFSFQGDPFGPAELVAVFREEFGYGGDDEGGRRFSTLFTADASAGGADEWFDLLP